MADTADKAADASVMTLSLTVDLFVADEQRQLVLNSIRRYRALCRESYAILLLAQTAGAHIEHDAANETLSVSPNSERAKTILAAAMNKEGKALAYELRDWILREQWPTAMSFVWDSLRRDVVTVWTSKDPEFTRANRGWLALQGARGVAQFNWRGIGFPAATGRPRLAGHTLTLKWDHDIGDVTFSLPPKLDGERWHIWRTLRDRGCWHIWRTLRDTSPNWKLGTLFLNERDGQLRATISYSRPARVAVVDPDRVCSVKFGAGESFLSISGPDGASTWDTIGDAEVLAWLASMRARREELERRRAACGNPRRPWGHRHGWLATQDVLSRLTKKRDLGQADRNHAWTRRIVTRAVAWRCGRIEVGAFPEGGLGGYPWKWTQFCDFLRYKAKDPGITVVF